MDKERGVNIQAFLQPDKSMIIAPAGYGKTHTIVDCLEQVEYAGKKTLVLTHTHAGIASLREKISARKIPSQKYELNTICSFALNLSICFIPENKLADDSDMNTKFQEALQYAIVLLKARPVLSVMRAKYDHIIVDEYQDCDVKQHELIEALGQIIKVHILGDPLQGIFDFNGTPVDLDSNDFDVYKQNLQTLKTPWRWINAENPELGETISQIRDLLKHGKSIDLTSFKAIEFIHISPRDLYDPKSDVCNLLRRCLSTAYKASVLLIHPEAHSKAPRTKLAKMLYNLGVLESIDDRDYYNFIHEFETKDSDALIVALINFIKATCAGGSLDKWFHENGTLIQKKKEEDQKISEQLASIISLLKGNPRPSIIVRVIESIRQKMEIRVIRQDVYHTIERVLLDSENRHISLTEALKQNRDKVRRSGRNIKGKYLGTTLLTKGLECDTVIVLNADKFKDAKHLYVALSRCSRRLIVASEKPFLPSYSITKDKKDKSIQQLSLFTDADF